MNKREDALKEALQKNEEEIQRWQTYLKENETAIENMTMFSKRLRVDVMVPLGTKALMPGHLIHTNEVLVGHYQGYFSKCSAFKAKEICEQRIKMAKDHLKKLETETELWQNKLEKPYIEGVVPTGEERDIIEDYDEEAEKLWKQKHRQSVKQAKQKEREEREKLHKENFQTQKEKTDDEILKMLEEAELMEELEQELDKLDLEEVSDETIRKLMSGEIKLSQEKKRISHEKDNSNENNDKGTELTEKLELGLGKLDREEVNDEKRIFHEKDSSKESNDKGTLTSNIVKKSEVKDTTLHTTTNNNVQPNPEIMNLITSEIDEEEEEEPLPEELALIKKQAQFLTPEDQIGFYEYQIEIIRQKLLVLPLSSQEHLNEKIHLLTVMDYLWDLLDAAEETVGKTELTEEENSEIDNDIETGQLENPEDKKEKKSLKSIENKTQKKPRISFASTDQTLEFNIHETVNQMKKPARDIIRLNDDEEKRDNQKEAKICSTPQLNKKDLILAKVEKSLQFVSENQSEKDFDLVGQIIQNSVGESNTLHIKFQHSNQEGFVNDNNESVDIPCSPADLYDLYVKSQEALRDNLPSTLFTNSYKGEDQVKVPVLREKDREAAYVDPKAEFSNPLLSKSILKNKSAVKNEQHSTEPKQNGGNKKSKKKGTRDDEDESLSAYFKVMNDVVENPIMEADPLPNTKFINTHAPKKRISRFKQMRQGTEKT